jgi:hypothetical protein
MPLVNLIFFAEPRELTDAQVEEARTAGHLREDPAEDAPPVIEPPAAAATVPDAQPEEN